MEKLKRKKTDVFVVPDMKVYGLVLILIMTFCTFIAEFLFLSCQFKANSV